MSGGGAERVTSHMASYWASKGHSITLITYTSADNNRYELPDNVRTCSLDIDYPSSGVLSAIANNFKRITTVRSKLKELQPHVVISMMATANILTALACIGLGIKTIGCERNYPGDDDTPSGWKLLRKRAYRLLNHVVAQTDQGKSWLEENTNAQHCVSIPNPIILPLPSFQPHLSPSHYAGQNIVLGVGRLTDQKQFSHLIHAFSKIAIDHPQWKLIILGDGEQRQQLQALVESLSCSEQIELPGRAGNIADWLKIAEIFVLSSRTEGFPNALIEAMAHNTAVISYDCKTGPNEIIEHGVNGLLVSPNDEAKLTSDLNTLIKNEPQRVAFSREAEKIKNKLDINTIMKSWDALVSR